MPPRQSRPPSGAAGGGGDGGEAELSPTQQGGYGPTDSGDAGNAGEGGYGATDSGAAGGGGQVGSAGAPASGGAGSTEECSAGPIGPVFSLWQPGAPADATIGVLLSGARAKLTGNWRGQVDSAFRSLYWILISFNADGSYSAHCSEHSDYPGSSPGCCRAFYYGTDKDSSLKQWTLSTADDSGRTSGDLDIIYDYETAFGESGYQGEIVNLEFDATGNRARFDFLYGDIMAGTYNLERMP